MKTEEFRHIGEITPCADDYHSYDIFLISRIQRVLMQFITETKKIAWRYSEMLQKSACLIIVKLHFSVPPGARHLRRKWAGLQQLGAGRTLLLSQLVSQNQFHPLPRTFCLGSL